MNVLKTIKTITAYAQFRWDHIATKGDRAAINVRRHDRFMLTDPQYRREHAYGKEVARAIISAVRAGRYRSSKSKLTGGPSGPWQGGGAADTHVLNDWQQLSERARQLMRDDPLASSIRKRFLKSVIGAGLRPQATTDDAEKNKRLESIFNKLSSNFDAVHRSTFVQLQKLIFSTGFFDGDTLLRKVIYPDSKHLQFEIIEADRVLTPTGAKPKDPEGRIVHGVEKDRHGRIIAYFIRKQHPQEAFVSPGAPSKVGFGPEMFWRITADSIMRLWDPERPGQTRGVSSLHAVIKDIRDLDFLMNASLERISIAAALAVFIKSPESLTKLLGEEGLTTELADESRTVLESTIEPGAIYHLYPGEEMSTLVPNFPTPALMEFVKVLAMRVAAALGITWEELLGNYSEDNYSTARTAILDSRLTYAGLREWLTSLILTPVWLAVHEHQRLLDSALYLGITDDDLQKISWTGPMHGWVDPLKEAKADIEALKAGTKSYAQILGGQGVDWQDHFAQLALERDALEKLGLDHFVPMPKEVASGGGTAPDARAIEDAVENALLVAG